MKKPRNRIKNLLAHWQWVAVFLALFDILAVNFSYFFALWVRFDCKVSEIDPNFLQACLRYMPINTLVCLVVFFWQRLYHSIWRFASFVECSSADHLASNYVVCGRQPKHFFKY